MLKKIVIGNINKYINYLFIALIFLMPFDVVVMNWIPPVIILLWIMEGNFKYKWDILKNCKIFWVLLTFILVMIVATFINPPYNHGIYPSNYFNGFDLIFRGYVISSLLIIIAITNLNKKTIKYMIYAFILSMFISEIKSYLIFFKIIRGRNYDPTPFLSHSFYTAFLSFTIILLIDNFFKIKNIYLKIFDLLFTLTATTNLFINGGRIGQVEFIFLILFYLIYKFRRNLKIILSGILVIFSVYIIAYHFSPVFKYRINVTLNSLNLLKKRNSYFYRSSFGQRVLMWKICLDDFKYDFSLKKLLLGNGFGKSKQEYNKIKDKYYKNTSFINHLTHPHSMYVYLLFNGGIILLALYLYIIYSFFRLNFYEYDIYAKIFGLTVFFTSFTEDMLYRMYGMLFFVLFTGLFYAYRRIRLTSTYYETSNTEKDSV